MEFCVIAPTCLLEQYAVRSRWQMCVAAWALDQESNPAAASYWMFYKSRVAAKDVVILDNGAYEGQMVDPGRYVEMIVDLKPTAYVVPDVIGDHIASMKLAEEFHCASSAGRIEVFQGQNENQLSYFMHSAAKRGVRWIALPKHAGKKRVEFAEQIHRQWPEFWVHALGFIDDNPLAELPVLARLGVRSIDSSEPVWEGLCGRGPKFKSKVHIRFQDLPVAISKRLVEVFQLCGARESTMIVTTGPGPAQPQRQAERAEQAGIAATLAARGGRYGVFADQARITQSLKYYLRSTPNWAGLSDDKKEALEMIASKIARILNGDPNYHDSWHDIEGYARLVSNTLQEEKGTCQQ